MIKGINRQIIEVTQTENNYFEKAWLVIKPEYINAGASAIEREAEKYLKGLKPPHSMRSCKALVLRVLSLVCAAISGGLLTAAVLRSGLF